MTNSERRVLVVAPSAQVASTVLTVLSSAGFQAARLTDFRDAREALDADPPDLLITEVRLGAYNGLHLAIRARGRGLPTPIIVVGPSDAILEAEARRQEAFYLESPVDPDALTRLTDRVLLGAQSIHARSH
jgi:DNA-binding NtrC family response regulator